MPEVHGVKRGKGRQPEKRATVALIADVADSRPTSSGSDKAEHRMIAAILDHPEGQLFVKASGPASSMNKWEASIDAFLKSTKKLKQGS